MRSEFPTGSEMSKNIVLPYGCIYFLWIIGLSIDYHKIQVSINTYEYLRFSISSNIIHRCSYVKI